MSKSRRLIRLIRLSIILPLLVTLGCVQHNNRRHIYLETENQIQTPHSGLSCHFPYEVRSGESLSKIAAKCEVDMKSLAFANHLRPPYKIFVGQKLVLMNQPYQPSKKSMDVVEASPIKKTYSVNRLEQITIHKKQQSYLDWRWPMAREIPYQYKTGPNGKQALAFYPPLGTPVKAVAAGEVVYAGDAMSAYGEMVILKHESGYLTVYANNLILSVKKGDLIKQGQIISISGESGDVSLPTLYFEARYLGRKVDVKTLLAEPRQD